MVIGRRGRLELRHHDRIRWALNIGVHVVDNSLEVIGRFLQLPQLLVGSCLIMECRDDEGSINCLATVGSKLKQLLRLLQIHQPLLILLIVYTFHPPLIQLLQTIHKPAYTNPNTLPSSLTVSLSSTLPMFTSLRSCDRN